MNVAPPPEAPAYEARGDFTFADEVIAAGYFGSVSVGNIDVSERTALGVTAWYRGLAILAGTIGGLPLKTYRDVDGRREKVASWLDNPGGPLDMTPAEWVGQTVQYLASGGEVFLLHIYDEAGRIVGAWPVHRSAIANVERRGYTKWFQMQTADGEQEWIDSQDMTQIMLLSLDGLRGEDPISLFRKGLAFNIAGQDASTTLLTDGFTAGGLVTSEEDIDGTEATTIKAALNAKTAGAANAGKIAFVNRALKFTPWQSTAADAQFIEQRGLGVAEVARMLGMPRHLLALEGASDFGTGLVEMNQGLARYTLRMYTDRIEQALSRLLPKPRFCQFEYKALLEGTPKDEIGTLIAEMQAGLITKDEARAIMNLPPLTEEQKVDQAPAPAAPPSDPKSQGGDGEDA